MIAEFHPDGEELLKNSLLLKLLVFLTRKPGHIRINIFIVLTKKGSRHSKLRRYF